MKKIAIENDHTGTQLKIQLKIFLDELEFEVVNYGTDSEDSVDYADYVYPVANAIKNKDVDVGILLFGSAQGVAILD
jgi:ribose 5-phosphate isomerase B